MTLTALIPLKARTGIAALAAALSLAFAPNANATIVGSTYDFTTSVTGNTQISPLGGPTLHTDPVNPGFCVGPPVACGTGSGVSGAYSFATVSPTLDHINFSFFGSTAGAGPGSFTIDLGHFATTNGEVVTGVSLASGSLGGASITESFNGTDARFTFSTGSDYNAIGGNFVTFNVTTVPGPIVGAGLPGLRRVRCTYRLCATASSARRLKLPLTQRRALQACWPSTVSTLLP